MRKSLIKNALTNYNVILSDSDIEFLAEETKTDIHYVRRAIHELKDN
jgi:hypothetical protein